MGVQTSTIQNPQLVRVIEGQKVWGIGVLGEELSSCVFAHPLEHFIKCFVLFDIALGGSFEVLLLRSY